MMALSTRTGEPWMHRKLEARRITRAIHRSSRTRTFLARLGERRALRLVSSIPPRPSAPVTSPIISTTPAAKRRPKTSAPTAAPHGDRKRPMAADGAVAQSVLPTPPSPRPARVDPQTFKTLPGTCGLPVWALLHAAKHRARLLRLSRALFDGSRRCSMARSSSAMVP